MLKRIVKLIPISIIILISAVLRLQNLGYSDYQGDEIKAFFDPTGAENIGDFLLTQRKGPGQFFITFLIKLIDPTYSSELLARLPFAIAGILAVFFFYKLIKNVFDEKVAFYAAFFFATNGFFVALSRIVQYQPFVMLFMVLALYSLERAVRNDLYKNKGLFLGVLYWSLSALFHYDAVFIAPVALYYIYMWGKKYIKKYKSGDAGFKILRNVILLNIILLSLFYIPFILKLGQSTLNYWSGRIIGDVSSKISSSKYLFTVYQPIYVIHMYLALFISGAAYVLIDKLKRFKIFLTIFSFFPKYEYDKKFIMVLLIWLLLPVIVMEQFIYIPGTHIYVYLIPLFIFLALGIVLIEKFLMKFKKFIVPQAISYTYVFIVFLFIFAQSYSIFVNHSKEYPWESKKFLIWEFHQPTPIYHLSLFGFPYYRNWEGIRDAIIYSDNNGFYSTNERESIARHYVPFKKDTDSAGHYIHILNSQSFTDKPTQEKARYWFDRYPPIFTFGRTNTELVRVYKMEPGTLDEIKSKGY